MIENGQEWFDDLFEEVEEKILSITKFKTHRLRKQFLGDLKTLINNAVSLHTVPSNPIKGFSGKALGITRPHNQESNGFAVMTEGLSAAGDDQAGRKIEPPVVKIDPHIQKVREHNAGIRHH